MKKIKLSQDILDRISCQEYYSVDDFVADAKAYIAAVKAGRLLMDVMHVSRSGMSRHILIRSYEGTMKKGYYRRYRFLLKMLGYILAGDSVVVSGAGMDMVFDTNRNIIRKLYSMGFIDESTAEELIQKF
jgi:hypothetical protein